MRITKQNVEKLPRPTQTKPGQTAQKRYYDDTLKQFGVRLTSGGTIAFFIEKNINHKLRRITLGQYPAMTVEMARKKATELLGKIAMGIDPVAEKRADKAKEITLEAVFGDYLDARKSLKPNTVFDYKRILSEGLADWATKPMLSITKNMVEAKHKKLGEKSEARANLTMRLLRALFNFAQGKYEDAKGQSLFLENPVNRLSHTRAWYKVERRRTIIKLNELKSWYEAVTMLPLVHISKFSETFRDYLLLLLFTGLRRQEAAKLTWQQVDLESRTLTVTDTKNHHPHTLPLTDYLFELFIKRKNQASTKYVFPGEGKHGYILEPRKAMAKVTELSKVEFTLHDLRRTFITIAESLDIPSYALKRLLNHKMNHDITAGYIIMDVERLRKPMEKITSFILKVASTTPNKSISIFQERSL